jgi:hypothetical protein
MIEQEKKRGVKVTVLVLKLQKEAEILRARGFLEPSEKQPYFSLQETRFDALARIRGVLLKDGVLVDCVVLEVEFTPLGLCTLWPGELKLEDGMYRLFGTLYGHLMDCHGRVLYRLFI